MDIKYLTKSKKDLTRLNKLLKLLPVAIKDFVLLAECTDEVTNIFTVSPGILVSINQKLILPKSSSKYNSFISIKRSGTFSYFWQSEKFPEDVIILDFNFPITELESITV